MPPTLARWVTGLCYEALRRQSIPTGYASPIERIAEVRPVPKKRAIGPSPDRPDARHGAGNCPCENAGTGITTGSCIAGDARASLLRFEEQRGATYRPFAMLKGARFFEADHPARVLPRKALGTLATGSAYIGTAVNAVDRSGPW